MIAGWNAQNHLVVGRNVKPGQQIQLAIFGVNGHRPLGDYVAHLGYALYRSKPGSEVIRKEALEHMAKACKADIAASAGIDFSALRGDSTADTPRSRRSAGLPC